MPSHVLIFKGNNEEVKNDPFCKEFMEAGFRVTAYSAIEFTYYNGDKVTEELKSPHQYSALVITSKHCVEGVAHLLAGECKSIFEEWCDKMVLCTGPATQKCIDTSCGISAIICKPQRAEGIINHLVSERKTLTTGPVLYLCGDLALDYLPKALEENLIPCHSIPLYKTVPNPQLRSILECVMPTMDGTEILTFSSPSGFKSVLDALETVPSSQTMLHKLKLVALGPFTAKAITDAGFKVWALAEEPTPQSLCDAVKMAETLDISDLSISDLSD